MGQPFSTPLNNNVWKRFPNSKPSRYVKVAQVLIKRINPETQEHEFLFQYDVNANQYQLIGGRWSEKDGSNLKTTIVREIEEELPLNHLTYQDAYELNCLLDDLVIEGTISNTFGALTHYTFTIYHMTDLNVQLKLQSDDHWVPVEMILDGVVKRNGKAFPFTNPEIYQRINDMLDNGLLGLPVSTYRHNSLKDFP